VTPTIHLGGPQTPRLADYFLPVSHNWNMSRNHIFFPWIFHGFPFVSRWNIISSLFNTFTFWQGSPTVRNYNLHNNLALFADWFALLVAHFLSLANLQPWTPRTSCVRAFVPSLLFGFNWFRFWQEKVEKNMQMLPIVTERKKKQWKSGQICIWSWR